MDFGVAHREAVPGTSERRVEIIDEVAAGCPRRRGRQRWPMPCAFVRPMWRPRDDVTKDPCGRCGQRVTMSWKGDNARAELVLPNRSEQIGGGAVAVSYTHLTLPT